MDNESGMEEERRLCYVGMTRAREKLILTGAAYRVLYGRGEYTRESTFLRELDKSLLDAARRYRLYCQPQDKQSFGRGHRQPGRFQPAGVPAVSCL